MNDPIRCDWLTCNEPATVHHVLSCNNLCDAHLRQNEMNLKLKLTCTKPPVRTYKTREFEPEEKK